LPLLSIRSSESDIISHTIRPGSGDERHKRAYAFRALAFLASLIAIGIGLELYVRWALDNGMRFDLEMWKYARSLKQVSSNPAIGHEHRPASSDHLMGVDVRINTQKLRDEEYGYERPAGSQRILMLGDSVTLGWGVPVEQTVSKRLEEVLRKEGRRVEVINSGVGNYNTAMEVAYFLTEGTNYDPQVVVLNYFINDAEPTPTYKPLGFLEQSSYAYVWLSGRFDVVARQLAHRPNWWKYYWGLYDSPGWKAAENAIGHLSSYCHARGIGLLIVNYPELRQLKQYRFDRVRASVREAASRHGAEYLDLYDAVRDEDESKLWVTRLDPHPNSHAHKLFADAMAPTMRRMVDQYAALRN
jgi:lysophospholipase L1-like esterase